VGLNRVRVCLSKVEALAYRPRRGGHSGDHLDHPAVTGGAAPGRALGALATVASVAPGTSTATLGSGLTLEYSEQGDVDSHVGP